LGLPTGIVEKSGAKVRELEGLPLREGLIQGSFPGEGIVIFENGFPFCVHLEEGQKTGHFLDQRENRRRLARFIPREARVLDACTYTGGFAIHAARFGAASVQGIDVSKDALERAKQNSRLNGVEDQVTLLEGDVFDLLRSYQRNHQERFDLIILDPPAFAKSRTMLHEALRGYKEINLQALKLLNPGGVLLTCSCSHALDEGRFKQMVAAAAADAERRLIQLDFCYQAPDHPILLGYDESLYLKAGYYRAL
jgi:23S rRNA (cytosine1962-C5)-methyltransferase